MTDKAYSYLRFSTPKQAEGDSFRRQRAMAESYAAQHGLILDETLTFQDLGISAFRSRNAKTGALRAFLDAVETGLVPPGSMLLVESLDRISRDQILAAQGIFLQIISASIVIVTLADGRAYSEATINNNPLDLIISLVTMMRANEESAAKSARLKASWAQRRAMAGTHIIAGTRPSWLKFDRKTRSYHVIERNAATVRRIFEDYIGGKGRVLIANILTDEGRHKFTSPKSGPIWRQSTIDRLLQSPMVIGTLVPTTLVTENGVTKRIRCEPIPNYYPAIVSELTFEAAQRERRLRKSSRTYFSEPLRNILSGLGRCQSCGRPLRFQTSQMKGWPAYAYLVCRASGARKQCRAKWIRYEAVQETLLSRPLDLLRTRKDTLSCPNGETPSLNSLLSNYLLRYQRLCAMPSIDLGQANELLRRLLTSVILDVPNNSLILNWRDGVVGTLETVWPASYRPKTWWPEGTARRPRKFRGDIEAMHEAYGLLNGERNACFPLLTLAQIDEARERYAKGETGAQIAAEFGVAMNTLMKRLNPKRKDFLIRTKAVSSDSEQPDISVGTDCISK